MVSLTLFPLLCSSPAEADPKEPHVRPHSKDRRERLMCGQDSTCWTLEGNVTSALEITPWGNIHFSTLQIRKLRSREAKPLSKDAQLVCGEARILVALGKTAEQTGLIINTSDGKSSNSLECELSFQPSGG